MKRIAFLSITALFIAACDDATREPIVSSFNEASVEIQVQNIDFMSKEALEKSYQAADLKAAEICKRGPNRKAEYVSTRTISTSNQYVNHQARLYLCLS